ncbi:hypothetical protein [uncultured Microscilla sp.]|uniref:hypothetical protein n=1 Tax=uncultured Microscilla sp. TaxID=432653 RepID=UPI00260E25F7|nr:hypothetical protein [uncultured Microscilla sp.]
MASTTPPPTVFSQAWWNELLEESNYLTEACLIKNSVPAQFFTEQDILNIIQEVPDKLSFSAPGLRVYTDGKQVIKELSEMYRSPLQPHEGLQEFTQRIFGQQKFGIILNRATQYHDTLARRLAPLYQGIVEELGVPWLDLNATIFVGNYGYTPFGVHYDGEANSVIHFHQGPGKKLMTLWDEEVFVEKTGSRLHYCEPEKILPYGTTCQIEAHDTFYLPEGPFHIGNTEEFSMALTVVIKGISVKDWLSNALAEMNTESFDPEILAGYESEVNDILASGLIGTEVNEQKFGSWVKAAMEDYQWSLKSNCGFRPPRWSDQKTFPELARQSVQIITPFCIYHQPLKNDQVRLYYRRNKSNFAHASLLLPLLERLNAGEVIEIGQIMAQHPDYQTFLIDFFTLLLNHQAIELKQT